MCNHLNTSYRLILIHYNTNTNISIGSSKDVNNGYKTLESGVSTIYLEKDGKKYQRHKWKDEPIKEYQ